MIKVDRSWSVSNFANVGTVTAPQVAAIAAFKAALARVEAADRTPVQVEVTIRVAPKQE